jgi:voltage-gated potassium channel
MTSPPTELTPARRRRLIGRGLLRAAASTVVLVVLYFVSPLERVDGVPIGVSLVVGLLVLLGVCTWQIRAIPRAAHPGVRAIEALAVTVPLFLLLFAAAYFVMAQDDPESFSAQGLSRSDTLYFTVTVFSTVGFGDISATSQIARRLVTVQMILDLLVLGLGIRVFAGAVQRGRDRQGPESITTSGDRS